MECVFVDKRCPSAAYVLVSGTATMRPKRCGYKVGLQTIVVIVGSCLLEDVPGQCPIPRTIFGLRGDQQRHSVPGFGGGAGAGPYTVFDRCYGCFGDCQLGIINAKVWQEFGPNNFERFISVLLVSLLVLAAHGLIVCATST